MAGLEFTEKDLLTLFDRAGFGIDRTKTTLFGLRGAVPANTVGGGLAQAHRISASPVNYINPRCSIGFARPDHGFAIYPGSTVPHRSNVAGGLSTGGEGVNQLCLGLHRDYEKGVHKASSPTRGHRALRMPGKLAIMRTADDTDFEADDRLEYEAPFDNLHAAWTPDTRSGSFSSLGCQVIVGFPRPVEVGPWKEFVTAIYALAQTHFDYGLFGGGEAQFVASLPAGAGVPYALRYGASDDKSNGLVTRVQQQLQGRGFMSAEPDGDFGFKTLIATLAFQRTTFGKAGADGIAGPQTGSALGIEAWPTSPKH